MLRSQASQLAAPTTSDTAVATFSRMRGRRLLMRRGIVPPLVFRARRASRGLRADDKRRNSGPLGLRPKPRYTVRRKPAAVQPHLASPRRGGGRRHGAALRAAVGRRAEVVAAGGAAAEPSCRLV